ncbi:MAG: hypothetical protein IJP89_08705 [Synergistaceae bacterium]|nr:hypothetical protein [Synergistaceae bacterium]
MAFRGAISSGFEPIVFDTPRRLDEIFGKTKAANAFTLTAKRPERYLTGSMSP